MQVVSKPELVTNSFVGTEEYIAPEGEGGKEWRVWG